MNQIEKTSDFNISTETNAHTIIFKLKEFEKKTKGIYYNYRVEKTDLYLLTSVFSVKNCFSSFDNLIILFSELNSFIHSVPILKEEFEAKLKEHYKCEKEIEKLYKYTLKISNKYINSLTRPKKKQETCEMKLTSIKDFFFFNELRKFIGYRNNLINSRLCTYQYGYGVFEFYRINLRLYNQNEKALDNLFKFYNRLDNLKEYKKITNTINLHTFNELCSFITEDFEFLCFLSSEKYFFCWLTSVIFGTIEDLKIIIIEKYIKNKNTDNHLTEKLAIINALQKHKFKKDFEAIRKEIANNPNITLNELTNNITGYSEETIRGRLRTMCEIANYNKKGKGLESVKDIVKLYF